MFRDAGCGSAAFRSVLFQAEADLDGDLPVRDLPVLKVAADLLDLEPVQVPQGLGCLGSSWSSMLPVAGRP